MFNEYKLVIIIAAIYVSYAQNMQQEIEICNSK